MKNVLSVTGFVLLLSATAMAQTDVATIAKKEERKEKREIRRETKEVSSLSKQHFSNDFPDVNDAHWNATVNFDEVTFTNNGVKTTAFYDFNSQLVGTTVNKSFSDIPAKARQNIQEHYKGYKNGDVIMFDDNEANETDMILYGTRFEDEDNYFVSIKNSKETIVLKVNMEGEVSFFKKI